MEEKENKKQEEKKVLGFIPKKYYNYMLIYIVFMMVLSTIFITIPYAKTVLKDQCAIREINGSWSNVECNDTRYLELKENEKKGIIMPENQSNSLFGNLSVSFD